MREDVEMTFGEHIEELRRRVIYALLGLAITTAFCGIFYKPLLVALIRPYKRAYDQMMPAPPKPKPPEPAPPPPAVIPGPGASPEMRALADEISRLRQQVAEMEGRLNAISPETAPVKPGEGPAPPNETFPAPRLILGGPLTGYVTIILLSVICGMILASPWILYQIWVFVGVGLHPNERKFVHTYGPVSFFLFIAGAATFYFIMLPYGLYALMSPTSGLTVDGMPLVDPSFFLNDYFKFVAMMTLIFGLVFQTPLIVMFLAVTGIVPIGTMVKQQRIIIMILVVAAAVFTPPDPVTMVLMGIPLILLYEMGLLFAWMAVKRKRRREIAEGLAVDDEGGGGSAA